MESQQSQALARLRAHACCVCAATQREESTSRHMRRTQRRCTHNIQTSLSTITLLSLTHRTPHSQRSRTPAATRTHAAPRAQVHGHTRQRTRPRWPLPTCSSSRGACAARLAAGPPGTPASPHRLFRRLRWRRPAASRRAHRHRQRRRPPTPLGLGGGRLPARHPARSPAPPSPPTRRLGACRTSRSRTPWLWTMLWPAS